MKLLHDAVAGAAPTWDVGSASLLWVGEASVHRLHPGSGTHTETVVPQAIGAALPRTNGGVAINLRDGIGLRDTEDRSTWLVYWHRDDAQTGPAAVDPAGRIWAASGEQLIRVQPDGRAKVVLDGVAVTGLAWSPAEDRLYLGTAHGIDAYAFDVDAGEIGNPARVSTDLVAGLCVDADGRVWAAEPSAHRIRRRTPSGAIDRTLEVRAPTGCCFGGNDFTDLYVTAGAVFVASEVGVGLPTPRFPG